MLQVESLRRAGLPLIALMLAPNVHADALQPLGCLMEPERVADIGSPVIGVLESIAVERGDRVEAGQVIARLNAEVERAAVAVAESRAGSDADVRAAAVNAEFTQQQRRRAEELYQKRMIPRQALDQARSEADIAGHRLSETRARLQQAQRELGLARAQLAERTITSPLDGIVAERYLSDGERIEDRPVLRIAKVDPLHVQVVMPVALYGMIAAGDQMRVIPELPHAAPAMARVMFVDRVVDAASNTFRVQLELPNADLALPAGLRCRAELGGDLATADTAAAR